MRQQNFSHYGSLGGGAAKEASRIQTWEEQGRNDLSGLCGAEIALVRWVCFSLINLNPNPCFFLISMPHLASPMLLLLLGTVHTLASSSSPLIKAVACAQSRRARETRSLVQTQELSSAKPRLGSRTILRGKVISSPNALLLVEVQPSPSLSLSLQDPFLPQHTPSSGNG